MLLVNLAFVYIKLLISKSSWLSWIWYYLLITYVRSILLEQGLRYAGILQVQLARLYLYIFINTGHQSLTVISSSHRRPLTHIGRYNKTKKSDLNKAIFKFLNNYCYLKKYIHCCLYHDISVFYTLLLL